MSRGEGPQRRAQLVRAALTVITRHGVEATTTREIAQEAGLPLGLIHYYFKGKDEIFAAVMAESTDGLVAFVAAVEGETLADCVHTLLRQATSADESMAGVQLAQLQLTVTLLRNPALTEHAQRKYDRVLDALAARLSLADPALAADQTSALRLSRVLLTVLDGLLLTAQGLSDRSAVDTLVRDAGAAVLAAHRALPVG